MFILFPRPCGQVPPKVQHALRYAPAVALAAIVMPDLLLSDGDPVELDQSEAVGGRRRYGVFSGDAAYAGTMIVGMALFTLLRVMLVGGKTVFREGRWVK